MSLFTKLLNYLRYRFTAKTAHGVHSPFVSKFIHELIETENTDYYDFKELRKVRSRLLRDHTTITITDFGAGSKVFKGNERKISQLVTSGTSQTKFSRLYYKLINFCNAKYVVELGTSIGLNTLYLSKAGSKTKIVSIEGCKELYRFAGELLREQQAANVTLLNGTFETALPEALNKIPALDILFVDGNHRYAPTMDYFRMGLAKKTEASVFIFDDIHWSEEMEKAWEEIKAHPEVTLTLDLFYAGFVFFRKEQKQKEHFVLKF
ncbi:MAG: O-methyltransferase [Bacteroidia bacterium]